VLGNGVLHQENFSEDYNLLIPCVPYVFEWHSHYRPMGPRGLREVKTSRCRDKGT
jgi:hypothetical protein